MVSVYVAERVRRATSLHRNVLEDYPGGRGVVEVLDLQSRTLLEAHRRKNPDACIQLDNWHPELVGASEPAILSRELSLDDTRLAVAREHGYRDWTDVSANREARFDEEFEHAASALVYGRIDELEDRLSRRSDLATARSAYRHRATLLHYVAANGVETWRQRVPENAVDIVRTLLAAGADVAAEAEMYGGGQTTLALLFTSAHPNNAGLTEAIASALRQS